MRDVLIISGYCFSNCSKSSSWRAASGLHCHLNCGISPMLGMDTDLPNSKLKVVLPEQWCTCLAWRRQCRKSMRALVQLCQCVLNAKGLVMSGMIIIPHVRPSAGSCRQESRLLVQHAIAVKYSGENGEERDENERASAVAL